MIEELQYRQSSHLDPALSDSAIRDLPGNKFVGHWINTNRETRGIASCTIERQGDHFSMHLIGVGVEAPIDWPSATAKAFANLEEEAGQRTIALKADFELGFMTAETYVRLNRGVLVIVLYITFRDNSGRSNYVNREFFYQQD
jgi:hypothetical protein